MSDNSSPAKQKPSAEAMVLAASIINKNSIVDGGFAIEAYAAERVREQIGKDAEIILKNFNDSEDITYRTALAVVRKLILAQLEREKPVQHKGPECAECFEKEGSYECLGH